MHKTIDLLREILDYELESAERYRRFISLVMVRSTDGETDVDRALSERVRTGDVIAGDDGSAIILMSETNAADARSAVDRYKQEVYELSDLRFSLVTFPQDARGVEGLMSVGERRLRKALEGEPWAVVAGG